MCRRCFQPRSPQGGEGHGCRSFAAAAPCCLRLGTQSGGGSWGSANLLRHPDSARVCVLILFASVPVGAAQMTRTVAESRSAGRLRRSRTAPSRAGPRGTVELLLSYAYPRSACTVVDESWCASRVGLDCGHDAKGCHSGLLRAEAKAPQEVLDLVLGGYHFDSSANPSAVTISSDR